MDRKAVLIFCADNGIVEEGVTQTGSEVTAIVAENFTKGIATINSFAGVAKAATFPIDIGINQDMTNVKGMVHRKVAWGTHNIANGPAMTRKECEQAILVGIDMVGALKKQGYELFVTGEMGIGNTSTSSAVLSVLEDVPVSQVTGRGAGLSKQGVKHKIEVLERAIRINRPNRQDVLDVMTKLGGLDICGITGAFLGGAIYHVPIIVDGFISAVAANCAIRLAPDVADLSPAELSGGMQKRVGLARAIISKPEIIFFDEPTTGLDPIMADVINDLIIESARGLGATTLTITHDMASARKIADRIAMLYQGKIIWTGTVKEMDKSDNPYLKQFINGRSHGPIAVEV